MPHKNLGIDCAQAVVSSIGTTTVFSREVVQMKKSERRGGSASKLALFSTSAAMLALAFAAPALAQSNEPIKIGVIAEAQAVAGASIP